MPSNRPFHWLAVSAAMALAMPSWAAAPRKLELRDCDVPGVQEKLRCGSLAVPENPQRPGGRKINLNIVVLPALSAREDAVPLFYLAGGPGLAATASAGFFAGEGRTHREQRDVVLVDQRGAGGSSPLNCPDLETRPPLTNMYPVDAVRSCHDSLQLQADLSQYTTANAAADLDAVREALGYSRMDLAAAAYGTRLALAYAATYGQRARSAALVATTAENAKIPLWYARNAQDTLNTVIGDCQLDKACSAAFPEVAQQWHVVSEQVRFGLNVDSAGNSITPGGPGSQSKLEQGPVLEVLRRMLTTTSGQRRLPLLLQQLSRYDYQPLVKEAARPDGIAQGLYLSVTCMEDTPWITVAERGMATVGTFMGSYNLDEQTNACKEWNVPRVKAPAPERIRMPVLFIAGERDAMAPVRWARDLATKADDGRVIMIPKLGHFRDGLAHLECLDKMMTAFYAQASTRAVDDSCVATMTPVPFAVGKD